MPRFYLTTPPKSVTYVLNLLCYLCSEPAPYADAPEVCAIAGVQRKGRAMEDKRKTFSERLARWTAELVLVFIGVYAAFWLNNYQQHQQDAERRDRILASIEQTLREGIE